MNPQSIAPGDSQASALSPGVRKARTQLLRFPAGSRALAATCVSYVQRLSAASVAALLMSGAGVQASALDAKRTDTQGLAATSPGPSATAFVNEDTPCADCPCVETAEPGSAGTFVPPIAACDLAVLHTIPHTSCSGAIASAPPLPLPVRIAFCRWLH
ncbi:hypothetical protein [Roseateles saccharophilus]|uniref:hypothetical protein n=1 Tax=Roseateles saccharophilus TaxID=304 RepID=UPI00104BC056|nr:hypothetical protein [Roseateles saccharophilus]MDG0831300.1 hypothetical protein [Roseateles saccharophilus]